MSEIESTVGPGNRGGRRRAADGSPIDGFSEFGGYQKKIKVVEKRKRDKFVIFDIMPEVNESGSASYMEISDIRQPSSIIIYMGSPARSFQLDAKFVARGNREAKKAYENISMIKSWRMPDKNDSNQPPLLKLFGFGKVFTSIPVVLVNYSFGINSESDLLSHPDNLHLPIVIPVSLTFKEAQGDADLKKFDMNAFKRGELKGW